MLYIITARQYLALEISPVPILLPSKIQNGSGMEVKQQFY
jgi:hypothetical protein